MSTCKERQAKRREKIKQDKELYQAYLEKDKERKATRRAASKLQMSAHQLEEHRVKERLRLREISRKEKVGDSAEYTDGKWPAINKHRHSIPYFPVFGEGCEAGTGFPTILST